MFQKPIEIHVSFDENAIVVQAGDLTRKFSNCIAIHQDERKIVEIGKTEAELSVSDPDGWKRCKHAITFEPIYDPGNFNPENMYWALTSFTRDVEYTLKGFKVNSNAICYTKIPGYKSFPKEALEYFEYMVQSIMRFRRFLINENETTLKHTKLIFAHASLGWGRWISFMLLLFLIARNSDHWASKLDSLNSGLWFVFPILLIASFFIVIWMVDVVWLIGMPYVLPKKFVRWIFQEQNSSGWSISTFLPGLILGKEN